MSLITMENEAVLLGPGDKASKATSKLLYTGALEPDQGDSKAGIILNHDLPGLAHSGLSEKHLKVAKHMIVSYAHLFIAEAPIVHYTQGADRWMGINQHMNQVRIAREGFRGDCSSTATFMGWRALEHVHPGASDVINGQHWHAGFTGTIAAHGRRIQHDDNIQIGDLLLYGPAPNYEHVTVALGGGLCFSHGGEAGPFILNIDYRGDRGPTVRFL